MSPGEHAALGRRDAARPQYANSTGFPPPFYPPYGVPHPSAWLGAPLISMTGRAPVTRNTPVSKLALHAQGAPLIIQNRPDRRKFNAAPDQRNHRPTGHSEHNGRERCEAGEGNKPRNQQQQTRSNRGGRNSNADAVSVASDESSGSTNSETMLPRIIKPRKRRKKDRKPNNIVPHDLTAANLELGEVDHCGSGINAPHGVYNENYRHHMPVSYRLNVQVLDYTKPPPEPYRVATLGEALEATRFGIAEAASPVESAVSSCQCRYCDPVGQIWDTESITDLLDENSSGEFATSKLEDSMKIVGPLGRRGTDTILRRSWSDPSSSAPERREANYSNTYLSPNLYSLFPPPKRASSPEPRSPLALEISSEIVTSINGHRDLEIKLFSTSPPATKSDGRSFFADKSESIVSTTTIATSDQKLDSVVCNDRKEPVMGGDSNKSEDVSETDCSPAFVAEEHTRSICDLALVTA